MLFWQKTAQLTQALEISVSEARTLSRELAEEREKRISAENMAAERLHRLEDWQERCRTAEKKLDELEKQHNERLTAALSSISKRLDPPEGPSAPVQNPVVMKRRVQARDIIRAKAREANEAYIAFNNQALQTKKDALLKQTGHEVA